jgi:hypothetical protein
MAKTREGAQAQPEAPVAQQELTPCRYRVELICPTPLAHRVLEIEAADEGQARAKFCEANGICDSVHQWKITRVA